MKLSIRRAVLVAVLLGMLLPALVAGLILSRYLYTERIETGLANTLEHTASIAALGVRESLWSLDKDSASALLDALMKDRAIVRIEVLDPHLGSFALREDAARREGKLHTLERAVTHRGETIGLIRIEISDAPLLRSLLPQWVTSASVLALQILLSSVLILFVLQRRIGQPLLRLESEAASLARGDLSQPIQALRADEIGQVESQLEVTRQALQGLFRTLEQKNRALEVDLRERMRVESTLRDREQRLRAVVEQSPLAVIEFDLGWHILDWNDTAARIFGWRREEVLGRHAGILLSRSRSGAADNANQIFDQAMNAHHAKLACTRSDQTDIVCQWYNNLIRNTAGVEQRIVAMVEDITERQHADDEIRRLATVVRLTSNLVALTNADGLIEWCNPSFEALCHPSGHALWGTALSAVLQRQTGTDELIAFPEITAALSASQALSGLELPLQRGNLQRWFSLDLQPIRNDGGQVLQWLALFTDITERHTTAEALRSLARIDAGQTPADFFTALLTCLVRGTGAQAAYLATHQTTSLELIAHSNTPGWHLSLGHHPLQGTLGERIANEGALTLKQDAWQHIQNDSLLAGCIHTEALIAEPITDSAQRTLGHIVLLFNAALSRTNSSQSLLELGAARAAAEIQRQLAAQFIQESEQKFSSIFQYAPVPIALLRRADNICLDVNPCFLEHFGYLRADIIGRAVIDTGIYTDLSERDWVLEVLAHSQEVAGAEMHLRTHDGDIRDCRIYIRPVNMAGEACLLVAAMDVTPLLEAQHQIEELNQTLEDRVLERTQALRSSNAELEHTLEQLKRSLDELVNSEKLASLGSLVAGITHELNTPIGNSLLVASTLRDANKHFRGELQAGLRRSALDQHLAESETATDILMRNLSRAAELISSFKRVAVNQTSSQRREFKLDRVVSEIIVTMQAVFRKTPYTIDNQIPPDILLDSYPGPLGQVIANLLNNALMHAFEGRDNGRITLSAERIGKAHVLIRCSDDGLGIRPEHLQRIFDPFFTTRLGRDGSGLGLSIVQNIVSNALGGSIQVDSQWGQGCCFSLRIPLQAPAEEPHGADLSSTPA